MRTKTFAIALLLALSALRASSGFPADQVTVVEIQDEPRHHVVFENAFVRILEADLAPGDMSLYHRHRRTNVAVVMDNGERSAQLLGSGMSPVVASVRGELLLTRAAGDGYVHRVSNPGRTELRFTDIEFIKPTGTHVSDSITLKPTSENDLYRAYRLTLAPGEASPLLTLGPGVRVILTGSLQRIDNSGASTPIDTALHAWQWHDGGTYRLRNGGTSPAEIIEIELK